MRAGSALLSAEKVLDIAGLEEGQVVLEVGPGRTGHMLFPAAERVGKHGRVFGLDMARDTLEMLEGLRRQYLVHHVDFLWMDIEGEHDVPLTEVDVVLVVKAGGERRGPFEEARLLYEDLSPPPETREKLTLFEQAQRAPT